MDNDPKLKDVEPPFDPTAKVGWREEVARLTKLRQYTSQHGKYMVPRSLDVWKYRKLLMGLDRTCSRSLHAAGAMAACELAEWINREGLINTEAKKTGISSITTETVEDWIELARRRELVAECPSPGGAEGTHTRWMLTERGHETIRSPFVSFLSQMVNLVPILISGIAVVAVWVKGNDTGPALAVVAALLGLYFGGILLFSKLLQRRIAPAEAVITIETYRSAGALPPSLQAILPPPTRIADQEV